MIGFCLGLILGTLSCFIIIRLLKPLDRRLTYLEEQHLKLLILVKNLGHRQDGENDP